MPRALVRLALIALCSLPTPGCWSLDSADLVEIGRLHGIDLTEAPPAHDSMEATASLQVSKSGFYLFGVVPIVGISMREAVEALATLAKERGADGVCNLRYHYSPPHPLKFIVFPVPDWSASVQVFGMAYETAADVVR